MAEGKREVKGTGATPEPMQEIEGLVMQMIQLAIPKVLGVTEDTYRSNLPRPVWDSDAAALGFDILVLVEPRVDFWIQLQHANIANYLSAALLPDPGVSINAGPYWLQVEAGKRHLGRTVKEAEAAFLPGERGLTALEGVSLVLQRPEILATRCLDLPGSRTSSEEVPCLGVWYNRVGLFARGDNIASPIYGAATCFELERAERRGKRGDNAETRPIL